MKMTLVDAINHCNEMASKSVNDGCYECADEHEQLACWLKELKDIREYVEPLRNFNTHNEYIERMKDLVHKN